MTRTERYLAAKASLGTALIHLRRAADPQWSQEWSGAILDIVEKVEQIHGRLGEYAGAASHTRKEQQA